MTKNWTVNKLAIDNNNQDLENLVNNVRFTFSYSDENITEDIILSFEFEPPTGSFVAYDDLTQDIVLNWLYDKFWFADMENSMVESITNPKGEIIFEETLPF